MGQNRLIKRIKQKNVQLLYIEKKKKNTFLLKSVK